MTHQRNTLPLESPTHHLRRSYRSILEYLGMVVAMFAGMTVLDLVRGVVAPDFVLRADLEAVVMATEMVIGMATWMVARRHDRRGIAVMSAVMYLPFLLLAPFFWGGVISGSALSTVGHLLMLPVMALAMPLTHRTAQRRARAPMTAAPSVGSVAPSPLPERATGSATM